MKETFTAITLSFMEAHTRFFCQIGGVHREMVYDNMRVAVAKRERSR